VTIISSFNLVYLVNIINGMKEEIVFTIIGGLLGYVGALIQHKLESKRQRNSEIRQEKIKIYSTVLTEMSGLFIDTEKYVADSTRSDYKFKFGNRLGRILGPARLISSEKLETMPRDLYSDEVDWHDYMSNNPEVDEKWEQLADKATNSRMNVEREMRKELLMNSK
jgi:hypothetical protein